MVDGRHVRHARVVREWSTDDRRQFLEVFLTADFRTLKPNRYGYGDPSDAVELQRQLRFVEEQAARGIGHLRQAERSRGATREWHELEARRYFADVDALARNLGEIELGLALESIDDARSGRRLPLPRLPLTIDIRAASLDSQLALALLERLVGARQSGHCPYCGRWWAKADCYKRMTCGEPECDAKRKSEWRKANPERPEDVAVRARGYRRNVRARLRATGGRDGKAKR